MEAYILRNFVLIINTGTSFFAAIINQNPNMMKKCLLSMVAILFSIWTLGQNVSAYAFTGASGTYSPISGGTVYGTVSNDDENFNAINLGFSFTYNGIAYTQVSIQTNGYVAMGSTVLKDYYPISGFTQNNLVSALGGDLQSRADGELMSLMEGSAPNRVFTVQWKNYKQYSGPQTYNFQIKLYETVNKIEFVYGAMTAGGASRTYQVGLKGASNADYNNRTTTSNWAVTTAGASSGASCTLTDAVYPASGQTFMWQEANQTFVSSTTTQTNTSSVMRGTADNQIIGIQIVIAGTANPLTVTQFDLNITGSTNSTDISNAKIYYTGNSNIYATTSQFGSTYANPMVPYTIAGSQALSGGTNYFWLAYDINAFATPENVVDAECTSVTVGSAHTPTVTSPAGSRTIKAPLSGTKTIGPGGSFSYLTLTAAIADLNAFGIEGPTVLELQSTYTGTGETFPLTINAIPLSSPVNSVMIMPAPDAIGLTVSGSSTTGILVFNGADYLIIDGRPGGTGSAKELTIENTSTSSTSTANTIRFINDAGYNTMQYCTIKGGQSTPTGGVILFSTTTGTTGNGNNKVAYCDITKTAAGRPTTAIAFNGTLAKENTNNIITLCNIFDWGAYGFYLGYAATGTTISQNNLYWSTTYSSSIVKAIDVHSTTVGGTSILRNKIYNLQTIAGTPTVKGIDLYDAGSTLTTTIANNFIILDGSSTTNNAVMYGIQDEAGTGRLFDIYHNSIYIGGNPSTGSQKTVGFYRSYQGSTTNFINNIVYNARSNSGATGSHYAAYIDGAGLGTGLVADYNDYYVSGSGSVLGYWETAATADLVAWQTASGQDASSVSGNPGFFSTSDLHIDPSFTVVSNDGFYLAAVPEDIDGDIRNNPPDIGADEFSTVPVNVTVSGDIIQGMNNCYNAQENIYVAVSPDEFTVQSGGEAIFIAGSKIIYYPGTRVFEGGTMSGMIAPGGPWCPPPVKMTTVTAGKEEILPIEDHVLFTLYPNPSKGNFSIMKKGDPFGNVRIYIYGMYGEKVFSSTISGGKSHEFFINTLPEGIYLVKVVADNCTETIKLIMTR